MKWMGGGTKRQCDRALEDRRPGAVLAAPRQREQRELPQPLLLA
jgi:hypothetical protein